MGAVGGGAMSTASLLDAAIRDNAEGRLDQAEAACRRILRGKPGHGVAAHLLAVVLCRSGRLAEGETLLRRLRARWPDDAQVLRHLVDALHEQGRTADEAAQAAALVALTPDDAQAHQSLAVALHALGRLDEAAEAYLTAARLDQTEPLSALGLGDVLADQGLHDDALAAYDHALQRRPGWALALGNASLVLMAQGRLDEAEGLLRRAIADDPHYAPGWTNLGGVLQRQGRLADAVAAYDRAVRLRPGDAAVLSNLAQALDEQGADGALEMHRLAVTAEPDNAVAHFNLGVALLRGGHWAEGWHEYEWRWRGGVPAMRPRFPDRPQWDGAALDGRTLLLHAEQGLGDTLQFVRFVCDAAARGGRIVLEAPPSLVRLLRGIDGIQAVVAAGEPPPEFELHLPLMSLPRVLALSEEAFARAVPYVAPLAGDAERWAVRLGARRRCRVGVAWQGNPRHRADRQRSMSAGLLAGALAPCGVDLVSLQVPGGEVPVQVADHGAALTDFAETAALVANLDAVVTVDTAVAHLAGAMGRPVFLLLAHGAEWRWGRTGGTTPWYPGFRLFRQHRPGDWTQALAQTAAAVAAIPGR